MTIERMPITPEVVTWARERAGYKLDDKSFTRYFPKIAEWEEEESNAKPTYLQLEKLADKLKVPVAVFFFPEPPEQPPIEETFRTLGAEQFDKIPPQIRLLLHKARAFQIGLDELNQGRNPAERLITHDLSFRPTDSVEKIAAQVRNYLGVSLDEQFAWRNPDTALKAWRKTLFNVGVYVFKDAFGDEEYCGFSLYDDEFPIIYVNNTHTKTRQIFTLFHELAHLLFHTSGVDTHKDRYLETLANDKRQIEIICNRLSARVLVPDEVFEQELYKRQVSKNSREKASEIARAFSVSREVIYRKFLEHNLVTEQEYQEAAQSWAQQRGGSKSPGGSYYRTKIAYLGEEYISMAFRNYYHNRIDDYTLAEYLGIQPKNLTQLEETVLGRSS